MLVCHTQEQCLVSYFPLLPSNLSIKLFEVIPNKLAIPIGLGIGLLFVVMCSSNYYWNMNPFYLEKKADTYK